VKTAYVLTAALAALMVVQSALGLLFHGQYRYAAWIRATWLGNEWITLVAAVPLLVTALVLTSRGSTRGLLVPIEPEAFKLVAALDISILATALTFGGVLLWRRKPRGYVVAAIAGIQASVHLVVLSVNSSVAIHRGLAEGPGELLVWGALAVLTTTATATLLTNVQSERA
jgi:hypothetical protein